MALAYAARRSASTAARRDRVDSARVERSVFAERLTQAAQRAREFARTLVEDPLPDAVRFRVILDSSYDGCDMKWVPRHSERGQLGFLDW
jgi:hypothetical protein